VAATVVVAAAAAAAAATAAAAANTATNGSDWPRERNEREERCSFHGPSRRISPMAQSVIFPREFRSV